MGITENERMQIDRASERIDDLPVTDIDPLSRESILGSLGMAKTALNEASEALRPLAQAIAAQSVSFAHFAAGARNATKEEIKQAIQSHSDKCTATTTSKKGTFLMSALTVMLSSPMALSVFLSVCVYKYGDRLFVAIFGQ